MNIEHVNHFGSINKAEIFLTVCIIVGRTVVTGWYCESRKHGDGSCIREIGQGHEISNIFYAIGKVDRTNSLKYI
ncbi:hypothetical protein [Oceanobacillus sp. CF4.6]|uniref:hypothetical protein n=1 Tax=Oceanobacillus sp. CF4.6 TaxID=3373080 RepID=UPI003EE5EBC5